MTITKTAQRKATEYGISETEIASVISEPQTTKHGKCNTAVLSRFVGERTVVVITDYARENVISTHVPDDEWCKMRSPGRHLTAHARERMEALGLEPADLDFVIANATKNDGDGKGNTRSHLVYEGRYLVVVTDASRRTVITVFSGDSIWSRTAAITLADLAPGCSCEDTIANLRAQLRNEISEAREERDAWRMRAEEAENRIAVVAAMLGEGAVAA